ncbi:MAG TPA: exo-alpha-sialidase, partial [Actinomycetes bacterium]|nr:exo-alpha-sialidase [Actinomycetes bacterium]
FPEDTETALARVWQLAPDSADRPGLVWAGVEPTSLWRSTDGGETFELVRGLWDHPHRDQWTPGFGGAAVHTVLPDPADDARVLVAMSTGGVYVTADGGASWTPSNDGISAYFLPDPNPEFGQCVHKVARDGAEPRRLYAQNHHGVYRSDDAGASWTSIADGLPSDFGFVMLASPRESGTAWVVPLVADGERVPPQGRLRVHRTRDAGDSWTELGDGLPDAAWVSVLRDAACVDRADPTGVYLGTRDGTVYASADAGGHFVTVAEHLPDVLCVRAVVPS